MAWLQWVRRSKSGFLTSNSIRGTGTRLNAGNQAGSGRISLIVFQKTSSRNRRPRNLPKVLFNLGFFPKDYVINLQNCSSV